MATLTVNKLEVTFPSGKRRKRKLCPKHLKLFLQITDGARYRILGRGCGKCDYCLDERDNKKG